MSEKGHALRIFFTDRRISLMIRWWAAGAVYFFIGWGTALGNQALLLDFVFTLGLVMGLFNMIFVNPGLRLAFNIAPSRRHRTHAISQRVSDYLLEIVKNILIMFFIALIYVALNTVINVAFNLPADNISVPGEPILFGIFYVLLWVLFERIGHRIQQAFTDYQKRNKS